MIFAIIRCTYSSYTFSCVCEGVAGVRNLSRIISAKKTRCAHLSVCNKWLRLEVSRGIKFNLDLRLSLSKIFNFLVSIFIFYSYHIYIHLVIETLILITKQPPRFLLQNSCSSLAVKSFEKHLCRR